MDLLGNIRQKSRDKENSDNKSAFKIEGRNAKALLLGGMPTSLKCVAYIELLTNNESIYAYI